MRRKIPSAETSPPRPRPTLNELSKFLFWSFHFSQGNDALHRRLFRYANLCYAMPRLTKEEKNAISLRVGKLVHIRSQTAHPTTDRRGRELTTRSFDRTLNGWLKIIQRPQRASRLPETREELALETSAHIIALDHHWLIENDGRPRQQAVHNPRLHPFLSHIAYYGYVGARTPLAPFDMAFKDATAAIRQRFENPALEQDLLFSSADLRNTTKEIVAVHLKHFPEHAIHIPSYLKEKD